MASRGPIVAIGIVIVVLLASPYGLGMLAESNLREQVETMTANPYVTYEVTEYERGWMSSQARVEVMPGGMYSDILNASEPMLAAIAGQLRAPFIVEIGHGPILTLNGFGIGSYAVRARLDAETDWVRTVETTIDVPYLWELRGQAGLTGGFRFEGEVPPFDLNIDADSLSFTGLDFEGTLRGGNLAASATGDQLILQSQTMSATLTGLGIDGTYQLRPPQIPLGEGTLSIDRISAINPLLGTNEAFALEALKASAHSRLNDAGNLDYGARYDVGTFRVPEAPEFSDVAFGFEVRNLDATAVDDMLELMQQMSAPPDPTMLGFQMLPIIDRIVSTGFTIAIDPVALTMDGDSLAASASITLDPTRLPTGQSTDLLNPETAMGAFVGELNLTASKTLTHQLAAFALRDQMGAQLEGLTESEIELIMNQQADQMITMGVAQGLVSDDGDTYTVAIDYENGIATVNGTPLPLEMLGLF